MSIERRWYRFIVRLCDIDEWLHAHARWLEVLPVRVQFCQWTWAERIVWDAWFEYMDDLGTRIREWREGAE